jgi:hypothetical protein
MKWDEVTDFGDENNCHLTPESQNLRRSPKTVPE